MKDLGSSNVLFHHLGRMKLETGTHSIVKSIDLRTLEHQIDSTKVAVLDFAKVCLGGDCGLEDDGLDKALLKEIQKLQHNLDSVFALMGSYSPRVTRSINFIGSGMKFLFGTMDNDDAESIKSIINNLGNRQDKLNVDQSKTIKMIDNMSKQWRSFQENQKEQVNAIRALKEILDSRYDHELQFEWSVNTGNAKLHLDNLFLSIQTQIDKIKNAILFLKSGQVS